ncbi:MAG: LysE family translocator [Roseovarius sp.]
MTFETYAGYLFLLAVFFVTPPDTSQLLIVSNSIRHGLRRSAFTAAGDLTANSVQMTAAAFGLATVLATSASAFTWIKWLGVAYLAWTGLQFMFSKDGREPSASISQGAPIRLFRQGFFTSMANPFAVVFFAALFPQFIDPTEAIVPQLLILGTTYLVIDGVILGIWGWLGIRAAQAVRRYSFGLINKICGALMIAAAALLATKDFEPPK